MKRVMIVDDHPLWRDALTLVLASSGRYKVTETAADVDEALVMLRTHRGRKRDVIVVDLDLPDGSGSEVLKAARAIKGATLVLVTADESARSAGDALAMGATAFIPKSLPAHQILELLDEAVRGSTSLPAGLARRVRMQPQQIAPVALTRRQSEVLHVLCGGVVDSKAIAKELHISPHTVDAHMLALFAKLGVNDRAACVAAAYRTGLVKAHRL